MRILKNNKGETMVELLFSILIAALAVSLLFGCVVSSLNINKAAKESDKQLTEALNKIEKRDSVIGDNATITLWEGAGVVSTQKAEFKNVKVYGDDNKKLYSYGGE